MKAIVTLKVEEDDVKKIFPSDYYTKFAHHLVYFPDSCRKSCNFKKT